MSMLGRPNREQIAYQKNVVTLMQRYMVDYEAAHARARATYVKARAEYTRTLQALEAEKDRLQKGKRRLYMLSTQPSARR